MSPTKSTTDDKVMRQAEELEESMSETDTSASENESEYSDSESEDDVLFEFAVSETNGRRIRNSGDCVNYFAIDVIAEAAKLGLEIRKKSDSIRVVGPEFTMKFSCAADDGAEYLAEAFDEIAKNDDASDEAKLVAFFLSHKAKPPQETKA